MLFLRALAKTLCPLFEFIAKARKAKDS